MGWGKYLLLGNLGNRLDLQDADSQLKSMRKQMIGQSDRDADQNARLRVLERENDEMKLLLIDLFNTLVEREVLVEKDTVEMIERVSKLVQGNEPVVDFAKTLKQSDRVKTPNP